MYKYLNLLTVFFCSTKSRGTYRVELVASVYPDLYFTRNTTVLVGIAIDNITYYIPKGAMTWTRIGYGTC